MCGRYRLSRRKQILAEHFAASFDDDWEPRYNIAPTQSVPVIRQPPKEPLRQMSLMSWGLIPHWAKDPSIAASTINAKSETAATKPAFRDPLRFRRCLIPGRWILRVAAHWPVETAILFRGQRRRVVRVRRSVGWLERPQRHMDKDVHDLNDSS
jgi:hypothetical protein